MDDCSITQKIERVSPIAGAVDLLFTCSLVAAAAIPLDGLLMEEIVYDGSGRISLEEATRLTGHRLMPAVRALSEAGLISIEGPTVLVREEVQYAVRAYVASQLSPLRALAFADAKLTKAVDLANRWFPRSFQSESELNFAGRMLPHGLAVIDNAKRRIVDENSEWWASEAEETKRLFLDITADLADRMATFLSRRGRPIDIVALRQSSLALNETLLGPDDRNIIYVLTDLAVAYRRNADLTLARATIEKAIQVAEARSLADREACILYEHLGAICADSGSHNEAVVAYVKAVSLAEQGIPNDLRLAGRLHRGLGKAYLKLGRYLDASQSLEQAVQAGVQSLKSGDAALGVRYALWARALRGSGDALGALGAYAKAFSIGLRASGSSHVDVRKRLTALVELARLLNDQDAVRKVYSELVQNEIREFGETSIQVGSRYQELAEILHDMGDGAGSRPAFQTVAEPPIDGSGLSGDRE